MVRKGIDVEFWKRYITRNNPLFSIPNGELIFSDLEIQCGGPSTVLGENLYFSPFYSLKYNLKDRRKDIGFSMFELGHLITLLGKEFSPKGPLCHIALGFNRSSPIHPMTRFDALETVNEDSQPYFWLGTKIDEKVIPKYFPTGWKKDSFAVESDYDIGPKYQISPNLKVVINNS